MAVKFLDYTGLGYFWSKIKAWCNATFAAITHNHASNAVNAMTGYSKPSSSSAIAASDSLNSAIGKLEAKVDAVDNSNVVHITGSETITGTKTFLKDGNDSALICKNEAIDLTATPSSSIFYNIVFRDKNNVELGKLEYAQRASSETNTNDIKLLCRKMTNIYTEYAALYLGYDSNGNRKCATNAYGFCTTPSANANDNEIVTAAWVLDKDYITSSSSITGSSGRLLNNRNTAYSMSLVYSAGSCDKGTGTSQAATTNILYNNFSYPSGHTAESDTSINMQNIRLLWNDQYFHDIFVSPNDSYIYHRSIAGFNLRKNWATIVEEDSSNITRTWNISIGGNAATASKATTQASTDNSTNIATTAFVKAQGYLTSHQSLSNYVNLNGAQTISGGKTFSTTVKLSYTNPGVCLINSNIDSATAYSGNVNKMGFLCLYDKSGTTNDAHSVGRVYIQQGTDSSGAFAGIRLDTWAPNSNHDFRGVVLYNYSGSATKLFFPSTDNSIKLGEASHRWIQLVAANGTISTSDERQKSFIDNIDENLLDAWDNVEFKQYKFNDAIKEKGINARFHTGAIAQSIAKVCKDKNLDISKYGLFCYDSWNDEEAQYDDSGSLIKEAVEAGDAYSLRYDEVLCVEAAYQRRKNKILENRISELEKQVSDMLQILQNLTSSNG